MMMETEALVLAVGAFLLLGALCVIFWRLARPAAGSAFFKGAAVLLLSLLLCWAWFLSARRAFLFGGPEEAFLTGAVPFGACFLFLGLLLGRDAPKTSENPKK